ncbi:OmpA family protein [Motiliproteus sp. SC1-56]|uniref:flagellar protein MotY n=1 Tax=Motiliproteus sp. SC1-56 TaxID=2799565 RepID=UPI001F5CDE23|nr:OmpA family protein [Motiliproteus sp. SC1-56]
MAPVDRTDWQLETSKFECRLSQPIPNFGTATFTHQAGESLSFLLNSSQASLLGDKTLLVEEAPPWRPGASPRQLATLDNGDSGGVLRLDERLARDVLVALYSGNQPAFTNAAWFGGQEPVKVAISAANFQMAYDGYRGCVADLLPVNYRQIARSALLFPSSQWRLSDAAKRRLDLVALYVNTDPTITSIFVDGHSDNQGRRLANRDLSRQRAEAVTRYLADIGVDEEMITTRYHGERYPVASNTTQDDRARNRRVTVRLERD